MTDTPQTPGDYIRAELEKRGWMQSDLADIINRPLQAVNEVILGKRSLGPEMAVALGTAFSTGPEIWMKRESDYRLSLLNRDAPEIRQRARLFEFAPVNEMEKRGWIARTNSVAELEKELLRFFGVPSFDQEPSLTAVARKSDKTAELTGAQKAWCIRAARLAKTLKVEKFRRSALDAGIAAVRKLADFPEKAKHLSRTLAEIGVRLVVLEPLPHTRIDGATFWLSADAPVVVLSMRHDRIDGFWFTLLHEMMHVKHGDAQSVDSDLVGESREEHKNEIESRADKEAAELLIPEREMRDFILRVKPFYSKARINQFAIRLRCHPGIVTGQLQHRKEITFGTNREMLAKVRDILTTTAMTDGWGKTAPVV